MAQVALETESTVIGMPSFSCVFAICSSIALSDRDIAIGFPLPTIDFLQK